MEHYDLEQVDISTPPRGAIWAANAAVALTDVLGAIADKVYHGTKRIRSFAPVQFISDQFWEPTTLERCETTEEVRAYARSIARTQPSFANELIAAANRADGE